MAASGKSPFIAFSGSKGLQRSRPSSSGAFSENEWRRFLLELAEEHKDGSRHSSRRRVETLSASPTRRPDEVYRRMSGVIDSVFTTWRALPIVTWLLDSADARAIIFASAFGTTSMKILTSLQCGISLARRCWHGLVLAIALAAAGTASAQSICEGLSTILTSRSSDLEFLTVPGAICERSGSSFKCIWPMTGPPEGARGRVLRQWLNTAIVPEIKKLSGAIQQCIRNNSIPYDWDRFRKEESSSGRFLGYFVQRDYSAGRPKTIGVCYEYDDDEVGAGVVLSVHSAPRGKSYCRW